MKLYTGFVALLLAIAFVQSADAQLTQIRRDYRQPMTYSPDDPFSNGLVYRLQTGQAGRYFNCDGEEAKRYSPYIYWQTVCNHTYPKLYCTVLLRDIHEVKERVRVGACRGGQDCDCEKCQQAQRDALYLAESRNSVPANPATRTPVENSAVRSSDGSADHVVYGSRASRQRTAQQGSFSGASEKSVPALTAEQSAPRTRR